MNAPAENRQNFESWFGSQIAALAGDREAGFIVTMVCFPLLERYLRQKSQSSPNTEQFNRALLNALPELQSLEIANRFWSIYRHGLLHNVALSKETHGLSHDKPILEVGADGEVWLNPNLFADRVLTVIRHDFTTFERGVSLPTVRPIYGRIPSSTVNLSYIGTAMPPGGNNR